MLYTVLRIGIFAVVLIALLLLRVTPWIAAIVAAVIGLCVTYLFFRKQRDAVVTSFYEYRTTEHRDLDNDVENTALDGADTLRPGSQEPREK